MVKSGIASTPSLAPYTGTWGFSQAAHLLRRTMFGAAAKDIAAIQKMTMSDAVDALLADQPADPSDLPLVWYHLDTVPDGQTWVNLDYNAGQDFNRGESLGGWWISLMRFPDLSIREKMVLFWHNHFACGATTVGDARYMYNQNVFLRANALGNFKTLVKGITLDPAMLRYLSGNKNSKTAPNENYGRELQELFTIGKGLEVSTGDYTTYTEGDIKAAARVLTGWKDDPKTVGYIFTPANHDPTDKQFSVRYGNTVIKGRADQAGAEAELDDLLTMIFSGQETAKYICRKIYRWFIDYVIDDSIEQNVIVPMAQSLVSNNFEIKPVLLLLFKSSLFYSGDYTGSMIKNPIDLVMGSMRVLNIVSPELTDITARYYGWIAMWVAAEGMQMKILEPPNVAGWQEYYEAPQYHELWLNSGTLNSRVKFCDDIVTNKFENTVQTYYTTTFDTIAFATESSDPSNPVTLIADMANLLYPNPLTADQLKTLHDTLIPGLPDYEWTNEWLAFINDPTNDTTKMAVSTKLTNLFKYMLELAEYQLM
jgi:uncharacterized protein (DUF1800 family)